MDSRKTPRPEGKSLGEFWVGLYRRKWVFLITLAASLVAAYLISNRLPAVYETRVVFFIPGRPPTLAFYTPEALRTVQAMPKEPIPREDAQAIHLGILKSDSQRERVHQRIPEKSLGALRKDVDFLVSNEYTLQVYARDRNPEMAARIANAYLDVFEEQLQETARTSASPAVLSAIQDQIAQTSAALARARDAVQRFEERNQTATVPDYISRIAKDRADTERLIDTTRITLTEVNQRLAGLQQQLEREASLYSPRELTVSSPLMESLRKELADLEAALAGARTEIRERHPDVKKLQAQIEDKRVQLSQEVDRILRSQTKPAGSFYESLRHSLVTTFVEKGTLEARIEGNTRLLHRIDQQIQSHPEIRRQYEVLTREVTRLQGLSDVLRTQLAEAQAQQHGNQPISVVVDRAKPPEAPSFPILWLNMLVAGILGLLGGIYYCMLLDYAQRVRERRRLEPYQAASRLVQAQAGPRE